MTKTETNTQAIQKGLAGVYDSLRVACLEQLQNQTARVAAKLKEHDWDFRSAYPSPNARMGRDEYRRISAVRDLATQMVKRNPAAKVSYRMNSPQPVIMRDDLVERQEAQAAVYAQSFIESYSLKLASKVAEVNAEYKVDTVSYSGTKDPFSHSLLVLDGPDGQMAWTTQCIINISKYGKLFNQWPTRRA